MSKKNKKKILDESGVIGDELSFAGKEAYNLLRTNLLFSIKRGNRNARVVGITSSNHGEGKSLTALNLGYSLACSKLNVLLIECDMRLPSIGKKLGITDEVGLSNILARMSVNDSVLHKDVLVPRLTVMLAGVIPPNPSELLGSQAMEATIEQMSKYYDFILLDLPPVGAVPDALIASKLADTMVVVVRQDLTTSADLMDTIRQLNYVDAKIAGVVVNDAKKTRSSYRRYGKYSKYGYYYKQKKK